MGVKMVGKLRSATDQVGEQMLERVAAADRLKRVESVVQQRDFGRVECPDGSIPVDQNPGPRGLPAGEQETDAAFLAATAAQSGQSIFGAYLHGDSDAHD